MTAKRLAKVKVSFQYGREHMLSYAYMHHMRLVDTKKNNPTTLLVPEAEILKSTIVEIAPKTPDRGGKSLISRFSTIFRIKSCYQFLPSWVEAALIP